MRSKYFFVLGLILFLAVVVSAGFEADKYGISNVYGEDSELSGWVEFSFLDVPLDSLFTDSMGNSISLKDVLDVSMNSNFKYSCNLEGCFNNYSLDEIVDPEFFLEEEDSKILGVIFEGEIEKINSIEFEIVSDVGTSCESQMKIDLLDDESFEIINNKASSETCSDKNYGCFNPPTEPQEIRITSNPFCQKVEFAEAPGYEIGAWIKEYEGGTDEVHASVYNLEGDLLSDCKIPKSKFEEGIGKNAYCEIDYSLKEKTENYVCIYTKGNETSNRGIFKARGYTSGETCGFFGVPPREEKNSYEIYVKSQKFAPLGTLEILDNSSEKNISKIFKEYILKKYGGFDCTEGCIVPLRIDSFEDQNISIKNFKVDYDTSLGNVISELDIYDLEKTASTIDANSQKLYLDGAGFKLMGSGEKDYLLRFKGQKLFEEEIEIREFSVTVIPTKTALEYPTTFKISTSPKTIVKNSEWDFGDEKSGSSTNEEITHTYLEKGTYDVKVTASDDGGITFSKEFVVTVGSPSEIIENILEEFDANIIGLKTQLSKFDLFSKKALEEILNFSSVESRVKELEKEFETAPTETEEITIMKELINLELPEKISTISTNKIPYSIKEKNINLDYVDKVSLEPYDVLREDEYYDAILSWNARNIITKVSVKEFYFEKDGERTLKLKVFDLDISERLPVDSKYFFIEDIEGLDFYREITQEEGYSQTSLEGVSEIIFSTSANIGYNQLPMFIAPDISELVLIDIIPNVPKKGLGIWFWVILILILVGGGFGYYYLAEWYEKKYENKLFPNKNNLYNLIHFIQVEKDKGASDSEIRTKLKKMWGREQIAFVMKKYGGENTGMKRLFSKKKKMPLPPRPKDFNTQKFNK